MKPPAAGYRRIGERGMGLISVTILMVVAGFFSVALVVFLKQQNKFRIRSSVDLRLQTALDAGYDKSVNLLNDNSHWDAPSDFAGFASLTAVPQTDLQGMHYWVKILTGKRMDTTNAGSVSDTALAAWTNAGDNALERTIVVRARDIVTGREMKAKAVVHRNKPMPFNPLGGIYGTNIDMAGWNGHSYNSCNGPRTSQTPGCNGSVVGQTVQPASLYTPTADFCLTPVVSPVVPPQPTIVVPTPAPSIGPIPMPGNSSVTQNWSPPHGTTTLGPGPKMYQCANLSASGNSVVNIDPSGGPVTLYVTGTMSWGGSGDITSRGPNPGGSPPNAIIYVNGSTVDLQGTGIYEILLIAPAATVTLNGGGSGSFSGAIISQDFHVNGGGNGNFYFDECLLQARRADNYQSPPLLTLSWERLR